MKKEAGEEEKGEKVEDAKKEGDKKEEGSMTDILEEETNKMRKSLSKSSSRSPENGLEASQKELDDLRQGTKKVKTSD